MINDKPLDQASAYHDLGSLHKLKAEAQTQSPEAIKAVAKKLEGLFLNMMLKSMREASYVFSEDNPLSSKDVRFYEEMMDQQLSQNLSDGEGIGLANVIENQLSHQQEKRWRPGDPLPLSGKPEALQKELNQSGVNGKQQSFPMNVEGGLPKEGMSMERYWLTARSAQPSVSRVTADSEGGVHMGLRHNVETTTADLKPTNSGLPPRESVSAPDVSSKPSNHQLPVISFENPAAFVESILPHAKAAANELGVSVKAIVAQAALETGWGKFMMQDGSGNPSFNFFGIKADNRWNGKSVQVPTVEYRNGIAAKENASFRFYESVGHAFNDYVQFLKENPRYDQAIQSQSDAEAWGNRLQKAGYATDPNYGKKIASIVSRLEINDN